MAWIMIDVLMIPMFYINHGSKNTNALASIDFLSLVSFWERENAVCGTDENVPSLSYEIQIRHSLTVIPE